MHILNKTQIKSIIKIANKAGKIAMDYFGGDQLNISQKPDLSTLTVVDSLISNLIYEFLQNLTPNIPVICEEGLNRDFGKGVFWLIDPIDGTSSFASNNPEFTINIALIKSKKPVFGLIFAPAIKGAPFYYTDEKGCLMKYFSKSKKSKLFIRKKRDKKDFVIIASKRSSDEDILDHIKNINLPKLPMGNKSICTFKVSSSLKFLYLIEGKADLYLHLRKSMEWDIAAGQALLDAAGGCVVNLDGSKFLYGKSGLENGAFLGKLNARDPSSRNTKLLCS
jgi:3'(2'), 5'-bisphosphate nucleotidase